MSPTQRPFRRAWWFYAYAGAAMAAALLSLLWPPDSANIRTGLRIIPVLLIWVFDAIEAKQGGLLKSQRKLIRRSLIPPMAGIPLGIAFVLVVATVVNDWSPWPAAVVVVLAAGSIPWLGAKYDDKVAVSYHHTVPEPPPVTPPDPA